MKHFSEKIGARKSNYVAGHVIKSVYLPSRPDEVCCLGLVLRGLSGVDKSLPLGLVRCGPMGDMIGGCNLSSFLGVLHKPISVLDPTPVSLNERCSVRSAWIERSLDVFNFGRV